VTVPEIFEGSVSLVLDNGCEHLDVKAVRLFDSGPDEMQILSEGPLVLSWDTDPEVTSTGLVLRVPSRGLALGLPLPCGPLRAQVTSVRFVVHEMPTAWMDV
jgi:hypothetical protein